MKDVWSTICDTELHLSSLQAPDHPSGDEHSTTMMFAGMLTEQTLLSLYFLSEWLGVCALVAR